MTIVYTSWAKLNPQGLDAGWEFFQENPLAMMQNTPLTSPYIGHKGIPFVKVAVESIIFYMASEIDE